jgi:hypothetical protein
MATVKDAIGNYIIGILDANTEEQVFNVAIDIKTDAERLQYFQQNVINPTTRDIIEYIPSALNFEDTPAGIKDIDKTTWDISLEFGFIGLDDEDTDFLSQKAAVEELRLDLVNNSKFTVDANDSVYNCKSIATSISRSGEIKPLAGYKIILMSMGISIVSGIGIKSGDVELIELKKDTGSPFDFDYTELTTSQKSGGTGVEYQPNQLEGADISKSQYKRDIWADSNTLDFNANLIAHQDLYLKAMNNTAPDEVYDLRITPPFNIIGDLIEKKVFVEVSRVANTGEAIRLIIKYKEVLNA